MFLTHVVQHHVGEDGKAIPSDNTDEINESLDNAKLGLGLEIYDEESDEGEGYTWD